MLAPKLRFKREDGTEYPEWEKRKVRDCLAYEQPAKYIVKSEQYNDNYETPVLTANKGFILGCTNEKNGIYNKGDVIIYDDFTMDMKYVHFEFKVKSSAIKILTAINDNDLYFMYSLLVSLKLHQEVHSRSYISQVEPMIIQIPCLEEQQKIAEFLSTVDEVIAQSEAGIANLEQQKKAAMQKIFSQQVRFKREDGSDYPEWEELTMREIFTEIIEKNRPDLPVLSIMQGQGTVYRANYDRNIMYDKKSTVNYKVMRKGDFIIHLRTFEGGLECATLDGISSPAYKVLRTDRLIPEAYKAYFRSIEFIDGRLAIAITGVRDGKNIEMSTFWEILVPVACLEEQQKIADFLSVYDETISYAKQELAKWKELKKGLLQQMFV